MDKTSSKNNMLTKLSSRVDRDEADSAASGGTVTRADLLNVVYVACPTLSRAQARDIFEATLEEIVECLLTGEPVRLRAFGAFSVRAKRERIGRNPRTGVEARIVARRVLTFKASPTLTARINNLTPAEDDDD